MRSILFGLACALALSGCVPMAMFASSSGSAYAGKRSDWGTFVSSREVNALCLSPQLRFVIWEFEGHFGKKVIMNSGYRDGQHNSSAGGADNSYHTKCMAADFYIPGVDKRELIAFAMNTKSVGARLLSGPAIHPCGCARTPARLQPSGHFQRLLKKTRTGH